MQNPEYEHYVTHTIHAVIHVVLCYVVVCYVMVISLMLFFDFVGGRTYKHLLERYCYLLLKKHRYTYLVRYLCDLIYIYIYI